MSKDELDAVSEKIIGAAYKVSNTLGAGFLEKVYENALRIELEKDGLFNADSCGSNNISCCYCHFVLL